MSASDDGDRAVDGAEPQPDADVDEPDMGDLFDDLEELEATVDSEEDRERVRETMRTAMEVQESPVFGRVIWGFDRADLAEAFLGSLLFGFPMFVEGGTQEVGQFVAENPAFLALTYAVAVGVVVGILYVSDIQDVRIHEPILGVFPRRLVGVLGVSLVAAFVMMTAWGRVAWSQEWLAFCQCSIAFVPMAIGAALGDILPGT